jgi:hypothetical protein
MSMARCVGIPGSRVDRRARSCDPISGPLGTSTSDDDERYPSRYRLWQRLEARATREATAHRGDPHRPLHRVEATPQRRERRARRPELVLTARLRAHRSPAVRRDGDRRRAPSTRDRRSRCSKADFAATYEAPTPTRDAVRTALRNLKACHDRGFITDAEFDRYQSALVAKL